MRVLLTTLSVASHFYPMVPLAMQLRTAGHEVAFGAAANLCPSIASPTDMGAAVAAMTGRRIVRRSQGERA
jgi:UDP:flavonoid glycosyltransferase YjiC (YdhE family)